MRKRRKKVDTFFTDYQKEIINKIRTKKSQELIEFLDLKIDNEQTAESIVRQFKYNLGYLLKY